MRKEINDISPYYYQTDLDLMLRWSCRGIVQHYQIDVIILKREDLLAKNTVEAISSASSVVMCYCDDEQGWPFILNFNANIQTKSRAIRTNTAVPIEKKRDGKRINIIATDFILVTELLISSV